MSIENLFQTSQLHLPIQKVSDLQIHLFAFYRIILDKSMFGDKSGCNLIVMLDFKSLIWLFVFDHSANKNLIKEIDLRPNQIRK